MPDVGECPTPISPPTAAREDALASLAGRLRPLTAQLRRGADALGNPAPLQWKHDHERQILYVSLEQQVCIVCGKPFDTGAPLMGMRLKTSFERHTVTAWRLCPEHEKVRQEGFVALVECDPEKSNAPEEGGMLNPSQVYRTGVVAYVKREAFLEIFKLPAEGHAESTPAIFVEPKVMTWLKSRMPEVSQ